MTRGTTKTPNPNVSADARRAQEEANHDAAAQEDEDEAEEVPGEDDDMDTQGYTSGYAAEEEDSGWHYRDTDLASRDIISSQRMGGPTTSRLATLGEVLLEPTLTTLRPASRREASSWRATP